MPMRIEPRRTCRKAEARMPERAPRTFLAVSEATAPGVDKLNESRCLFTKQANVTPAKFERAPQTLRSNA